MVIILHLIFIKNYHSASIKVYLKKIFLIDALVIAVVKVFSMLKWIHTSYRENVNIYPQNKYVIKSKYTRYITIKRNIPGIYLIYFMYIPGI